MENSEKILVKSGSEPTVSVLLCNYNYGRFIGQAIESVLTQSFRNFELIIVDDGSTDNSRDVIRSYQDDRIRVIIQENGGQAISFNAAFAAANGDIICFLDSDDWWAPEKLERVLEWDQLLKSDYAVLQHSVLVWDNGVVTPFKAILPSGHCFTEMQNTDNIDYFVPTSGLVFRRTVLDRVMPIPQELRIAADAYLTRTVIVFGTIESISEPLGYYRHHENAVYKNPSFDIAHFMSDQLVPLLNAFYKREGLKYRLDAVNFTGLKNEAGKADFSEDGVQPMDEVMLCKQYLQGHGPGVMLDVGAHGGGSAKMYLDSDWVVYAFEPDPVNRAGLAVLAGLYPKLHVDARAVSDKIAHGVPFFTSSASSGISSLSPFHASHRETSHVDTVSLSNYCVEHGIDHVDFLKIDTEGYDLFVLKGCPWEIFKPAVVLCEFGDDKTVPLGYTFRDIARYLTGLGYEILVSDWCPITEYGKIHEWRDFRLYPCELGSTDDWGNMLAFRDGINWPTLLNAVQAYSSEVAAQQGCEILASQLEYMKNSVSWRITKPLRFVKGKLNKQHNPRQGGA